MSVISDRHQFESLSKDSKAYSGQRLVRLISKSASDGTRPEHLETSMCVSIPVIDISGELDKYIGALVPHVNSLLASAQDKLIRELRIETGADTVGDSDIDATKCIAYLDAQSAGERVSAEYLRDWFTDEYLEKAQSFIRSVAPDAASELVETKARVLRDIFTGFASPKYSPKVPVLKAIARFGEFIGECDSRMAGYIARSAEILEKKMSEFNSDNLGF